jgi:uncharacterized membrane protein YfcA
MKHSVRFKVVCALLFCYLLGTFLGVFFTVQNNRVGIVLEVLIPVILFLAYVSLITQQVQPRKKKLPKR